MKKLTDVYIKVTERNQEELSKITYVGNLPIGQYLIYYDDVLSSFEFENENGVEGLKKVTLAELKRLIDTIPTREEIKRLKQQISAYKTNLSLVNERCKELQSDNESLKYRLIKLRELNDVIYKDVDRLTNENERLKNINLTLKQTNNYLYDKKDTLQKENAQLKQRKWYKFWK